MALEKVRLHGLYGNYKSKYDEGSVVYRKYGSEWHVYVPFKGGRLSGVRRAINDDQFIKTNILPEIKKLARPYSTINDKKDNLRLNISQVTLTVDTDTLMIVGYEIGGVSMTTKDALTEEQKEANKAIYESSPLFGAFLATPNTKN
jgi:hypothetical protein